MSASDTNPPIAAIGLVRQVLAAPHRLLFFVGATNVLLAMLWWAAWLTSTRWLPGRIIQPPVPAGWLHAMLMQYQVLPAFMFGFLLTVFPRWMNQPELGRRYYVPVGIGMLGGQVLTLAGLFAGMTVLRIGAAFTTLGWAIGAFILARLVWRDQARTWHAVSCLSALLFGLLGLGLYDAYLLHLDARALFAAIKLGSMLVLLPIFLTVCHRMVPFFAGAALQGGYRMVRPMWVLAAAWILLLGHTWMELRHAYAWLWGSDLPLMALTGGLLWAWWPRGRSMPALLLVLFIGFAWMPVAFLLYSLQSLLFWMNGEFLLGRAPAHALFVGCFGSLLVAMVTRVTQGHAGRPLVLGRIAAFTFIAIQAVALLRMIAEIHPDAKAWQAAAAWGWVLAFLAWALRSAWLYLTPRADGRPG